LRQVEKADAAGGGNNAKAELLRDLNQAGPIRDQ